MSARKIAQQIGDRTYQGSSCKKCQGTTRYTTNGSCIKCSQVYRPEVHKKYHATDKAKQKAAARADGYKLSGKRKETLNKFHLTHPNLNIDYYQRRKMIFRLKEIERKYGLSEISLLTMLDSQNNQCKICLANITILGRSMCVDHCHATGKVRGLLCHKCNIGIGMFEDDVKRMGRAMDYLSCQ